MCICNKCGKEVEIHSSNLQRSKMCKYCRTAFNTKPKEDLSGKVFGRLTVIEYVAKSSTYNTSHKSKWKCVCDCGNTVLVETSKLKSGHTKSCGCYMKEQTSEANSIDLTGQRFGNLYAISKSDGHKTPKGQVLTSYKCLCDCGNIVDVLSMNLVSGNTQSCGCIGCSVGEYKINQILIDRKIKFKRQYSFSDLRAPNNGGVLRFDFAIFDDENRLLCLIEFNGEQHYYPNNSRKWFGKLQREITDKIKNDYCDKNNIRLFEIRFDENIVQRLSSILDDLRA